MSPNVINDQWSWSWTIPLSWLSVTAKLGRDKGGLQIAPNLCCGPAAGETGLLNFIWVPADEGGEGGSWKVQLGCDPWSHWVVPILLSIPNCLDLFYCKFPVFRIQAWEQREHDTFMVSIPGIFPDVEGDNILNHLRLRLQDPQTRQNVIRSINNQVPHFDVKIQLEIHGGAEIHKNSENPQCFSLQAMMPCPHEAQSLSTSQPPLTKLEEST